MPTTPVINDKWQAGDRDSPTLPLLDLPEDKDKLFTFLRMEGHDGYDETEIKDVTGVTLARPRRLHLIFERMGFIYSLNSVTYLSDLGKAVLGAEETLKETRRKVARVAVRILRKYQLNNPAEQKPNARYPRHLRHSPILGGAARCRSTGWSAPLG